MKNSGDERYIGYLSYLYDTAAKIRIDANNIDDVVSEAILSFVVYEKSGKQIEDPTALLYTLLRNKHNDLLRKKYGRKEVPFDLSAHDIPDDDDGSDSLQSEEYENIRMQIGRLIGIYREVIVRHYVHGHSVEKIAAELGIPKGTVLSRLHAGREQIKDGIEKMEKYSKYSYEPKKTSIGIFGGEGMHGEPFSLLSSDIEGNMLVLAYDAPVSVKALADALGMPAAFIEPLAEKLIDGELMGKTPSGLLYTRCYVVDRRDSFGDIAAQEALADKYAERVWNTVYGIIKPLTGTGTFLSMSEKQKATMLLYVTKSVLHTAVRKCLYENGKQKEPPERPDAGKWLATVTAYDKDDCGSIYDASGPVQVTCRKSPEDDKFLCQMFDCQSVFGDAHWAYGNLKYKFSLSSILRFYASFLPCDSQPDNKLLYELIPEFEKLHILRRDEDGEIRLDVPALPFDETPAWNEATMKANTEIYELLSDDLRKLAKSHKNKVPPYVDGAEYYIHDGALAAYPIAQLLSIVNKDLMPYKVEVGKTPLIYIAYRKSDGQKP